MERILQEKDRLYLELRVVLERQPGPEVAQQITSYQRVGTHLPECGYTLTRGWVHTYQRVVHTYQRWVHTYPGWVHT